MPERATKQPSFGGVASLFGNADDDVKVDTGKSSRKQAPSFGGVAGLFGTDDDDAAPAPITKGKKKKAAPSFGGVAAMFADDNEAPPSQIITKTKGRQASFGGVAALFGDDDDDEGTVKHGKQASFGGVSGLFNSNQHAGLGSKIGKPQQPVVPASKPRKQQSFGGVAGLFGADDDSDADPAPPKGVANLFSSDTPDKAIQEQKISQKGKTKKRDPSFSGVSSLFSSEDDDNTPTTFTVGKTSSGVNESEIYRDLQARITKLQKQVTQLEDELKASRRENHSMQSKIGDLEQGQTALIESKMALVQATAAEMHRMRILIKDSYLLVTSGGGDKAATVS